jgi:hypothetical protein
MFATDGTLKSRLILRKSMNPEINERQNCLQIKLRSRKPSVSAYGNLLPAGFASPGLKFSIPDQQLQGSNVARFSISADIADYIF